MTGPYRGLPFGGWPQTDRETWLAALKPPVSIRNRANAASTWRPATRTTVQNGYVLALGWLVHKGLLHDSDAPAARWPHEVIDAYADELSLRLRPKSQHSYLLNLERALAVLDDSSDRSHLKRVIKSIVVGSSHADKRARLQTPDELEELGRRLMDIERNGAGQDRRKTGVIFRDGLQIALLARRPIRRHNFTMIEIGVHLIKDRDRWKLEFTADETKNHTPLAMSIPDDLVPDLDEYLEVYRPLLLRGSSYQGPALWIARGGQPQAAHSLGQSISKRTRIAFGKAVNPHLFRDGAATAVAIDDPDNVRSTKHILGHNNYASTQSTYNLSKSIDASRTVNDLFADLKRDGRRNRRKPRS